MEEIFGNCESFSVIQRLPLNVSDASNDLLTQFFPRQKPPDAVFTQTFSSSRSVELTI
jgi:hypothetical protein